MNLLKQTLLFLTLKWPCSSQGAKQSATQGAKAALARTWPPALLIVTTVCILPV
jgi:hypothetical protein